MIQYSNGTTSGLLQLTVQGKAHYGKKIQAAALEAAHHTVRKQGRVNACYAATFLQLHGHGYQPRNGATHSGQVSLPQDNPQQLFPEPHISGNSVLCQVNNLTLTATVELT